MKVKLYRENGALGSNVIFDALEEGFKKLGCEIVTDGEDSPVIWSVLWFGRMAANRDVYLKFSNNNKPVMVVEVGALNRGISWKLSWGNINADGTFNKDNSLEFGRSNKLGISLMPIREHRKPSVLLLGQHDKSLQWQGLPPIKDWIVNKIAEIKKFTDRPIVVRPHPRCSVPAINLPNVTFSVPILLPNTYSEFDMNLSHHCVINHNSGTTVQAAIQGVPVVCDPSGLAYPVSCSLQEIETAHLKDRTTWFEEILHTEWTVEEFTQGIPQKRLLSTQ